MAKTAIFPRSERRGFSHANELTNCGESDSKTLQALDKNVTKNPAGLAKMAWPGSRLAKMDSPDFLHKDAETSLSEHFMAAGALCSLLTNSEQVLEAARDSFLPAMPSARPVDFSMRFWVDDTRPSRPPWPKPYVRGLDHLIFAGFDEDSSMLANLRERHVIGRFSLGMAADRAYYKHVVFPMLLTIVGATVGIAELHAACVVNDQHGILLAGPSGAGKSTLALAFAQCGFRFISDDRTFCFVQNDEVQVFGFPTQIKLRSESVYWFPELRTLENLPGRSRNADIWFEPERLGGVRRRRRGRATSLIFLDQTEAQGFRFSAMPAEEALSRLTSELIPESAEGIANRLETMKRVADLPCWLLRYGGKPLPIAQEICAHITKS
jgi:hypothetical protein